MQKVALTNTRIPTRLLIKGLLFSILFALFIVHSSYAQFNLETFSQDDSISEPLGICFSSQGNLFVVNSGTTSIIELRGSGPGEGDFIRTVADEEVLTDPIDCDFDHLDRLWVTDGSGSIFVLNPGGFNAVTRTFNQTSSPFGITANITGRIIMASNIDRDTVDFYSAAQIPTFLDRRIDVTVCGDSEFPSAFDPTWLSIDENLVYVTVGLSSTRDFQGVCTFLTQREDPFESLYFIGDLDQVLTGSANAFSEGSDFNFLGGDVDGEGSITVCLDEFSSCEEPIEIIGLGPGTVPQGFRLGPAGTVFLTATDDSVLRLSGPEPINIFKKADLEFFDIRVNESTIYTINVSNASLNTLSNVRIVDELDSSTKFNSELSTGSCGLISGRTVECVIGTLPPNSEIIAVDIAVNLRGSPNFIINQASVQADGIEDVLSNEVVLINLDPSDNGNSSCSLADQAAYPGSSMYLLILIPMLILSVRFLFRIFSSRT